MNGKTLENLRKLRNVEFCHTEKRAKKLVTLPTFKTFKICSENIVAVEQTKLSFLISSPIYIGFYILEPTKLLMYQFHYDYVKKKHRNQAKLLSSDTDSLYYQIFTRDIVADLR